MKIFYYLNHTVPALGTFTTQMDIIKKGICSTYL